MSVYTNENCMDVMARLADKSIDLAIVDPPYGINISQDLADKGKSCRKNGYREWEYKQWDSKRPDNQYFDELFRVSKNQIIWGGNYFTLQPSRCWIIWDKMQRDFSFADGEMAWTSFDRSTRIFSYSRGALLQEHKIHPTQKPIALYKWLLHNYAKPGWLILDTHVGSASSLVACEDMGFEYIACELDPDYYRDSCERIATFRAQGKLEFI